MRRPGLGAALLLAVLMASTSGCMGLIAARESVESLREPAFESLNNQKITITHEFTSLTDYANEYTNRSTFGVTDQTTEIGVYFKVSFELSRKLSCSSIAVTSVPVPTDELNDLATAITRSGRRAGRPLPIPA